LPNGFKDRILYVSPDMLPKGSIEITACQINGVEYTNYDAIGLSVTLPESDERLRVKVTVTPK
jgi:predicted aconitase